MAEEDAPHHVPPCQGMAYSTSKMYSVLLIASVLGCALHARQLTLYEALKIINDQFGIVL
jgi:hypothetical protein